MKKSTRFRGLRLAVSAFLLLCLLPAGKYAFADPVRFGSAEADRHAEYIDLGSERIEDWEAFYGFLEQFPALRKVDLFATEIGRDRIEEMTSRFPGIVFGMTMRFQEHTLRTDATAFSTLHTPSSPHHREEDLSLVRFCTNLRALDLGHNRLSDLGFLYDLPELRILILSMNDLTDITPVGSLRHLEYLEVFNNRISDVSCLAGLPYLADLNLVGNRIADPSPILGLPGLKRLWMSRFDVRLPREQIKRTAAEFRSVLPVCEVDDVSSGIGGAWRAHPHYGVVRRIFASGVYEPFADSPAQNRPEAAGAPVSP